MTSKPIKGKVGKPKMKKLHLEETMPSPFGRRIVPQITSAMKADASKKLLKKKKVNKSFKIFWLAYFRFSPEQFISFLLKAV